MVEGSGAAASGSGEAAAKPAPANTAPDVPAAANAAAAPVISNQGEFNAWFQSQMGKSVGSRKVVTVVA